jgi:TRAP-type C4-dicarboxylate transport system substrate-binding protein
MPRALHRFAAVAAALLAGGVAAPAGAEPIVLRFGTVAPDGTAWARIAKQTSAALDAATKGQVTSKWYFGGIAGDELQQHERVQRDQLDGILSGGMLCQRLAPSMRAVHLAGLFQSREESRYAVGRLKPLLDQEFARAGFANLGEAGFGSDIIFSRTPIRSLDELRRTRMWVWDLDDVYRAQMPAMGLKVVPLPLERALAAYEKGEIDGFIGIPAAALAYQWGAHVHYFADLRVGNVLGCMVVAQTALDPLPLEAQAAVRAAAARLMRQMEDVGDAQDVALIHSLFEKQGMRHVEVSKRFRGDFLDAARAARLELGASLANQSLLDDINGWLADYRSEH